MLHEGFAIPSGRCNRKKDSDKSLNNPLTTSLLNLTQGNGQTIKIRWLPERMEGKVGDCVEAKPQGAEATNDAAQAVDQDYTS